MKNFYDSSLPLELLQSPYLGQLPSDQSAVNSSNPRTYLLSVLGPASHSTSGPLHLVCTGLDPSIIKFRFICYLFGSAFAHTQSEIQLSTCVSLTPTHTLHLLAYHYLSGNYLWFSSGYLPLCDTLFMCLFSYFLNVFPPCQIQVP